MKARWQTVSMWFAITLAIALMTTGCAAPVATEQPPATDVSKVEAPESAETARKVMTIVFTQEPDTLNPYYSSMWFVALLHQVANCWAWEYDDQAQSIPRLVTEIPSTDNGGVSADGTVITMHLRDDIAWSDGTPITSADFVFTYDMIMADANVMPSQDPYDRLVSLEAPDERTVVMTFAEPFAPWQSLFWRGLLPKHVLEPVFESEGSITEAEWNRAPTVSCGPYVFAEWESGSFLRFVKNEAYWLGQPKIDELFVQIVPDDASQTAAFLAGDADLGTFPPLSDVPTLRDAGLTIVVQPSGYQEGWFFNLRDTASPAIRNVPVRRAIAMAIDREAISRDLLLGLATVPNTYWDSMPAYAPPDITPWTYNPDEARRLLDEAGWTDTDGDGIREDAGGNKLVITHGTTIREIRQDIQAVAQQQLREVGIDLQISSQDDDIYFGSYADNAPAAVGDLDIMEWSDAPYFPDPDTDYWLCDQIPNDENPWGYNYFFCDEQLDQLFRDQRLAMDTEERASILHQIGQLMHDQVYWLGLYTDPDTWIVSARVTGIKFSGATPFYNVMEWDLTE